MVIRGELIMYSVVAIGYGSGHSWMMHALIVTILIRESVEIMILVASLTLWKYLMCSLMVIFGFKIVPKMKIW